eukprot:TRINITY_DN42968_c0_g1_i1.p1 TRINITY_DN42968_c0_g1~~TRINITY_DN42968_c0_g1_i1.p1  ORF type:complete len:196 (+),score=37.59 TRINITY_DN42968_c0_g1_i1:90-590(+)
MDANVEAQTDRDMDGTAWRLFKMARRKATVGWSVPAEVWLMMARPRLLTKPEAARVGVGYVDEICNIDNIKVALRLSLQTARAGGWPPLVASLSNAWQLDKKNGKMGTEAIRLIHGMCPWWKAWHRHLLVGREGRVQFTPLAQSYGCLKHRRREGAILTARVTAWR